MGNLTTIMSDASGSLDGLSAYELLEVPKDVPQEQIKSAFRHQVKKWHPDTNKRPEAEDRFKRIVRAYEILSDPEKRSLYDRGLLSQDSIDLDEAFRVYHEEVEQVYKAKRYVRYIIVGGLSLVIAGASALIYLNSHMEDLKAGQQEIERRLDELIKQKNAAQTPEP